MENATPCWLITGPAGSGKTTMVRDLIEKDRTAGILCATTGIAAVNLDTTTLNSKLGYFNEEDLADDYASGKLTSRLSYLARGAKWLFVDEFSMMRHRTLDILCMALDDVNQYKTTKHPLGIALVGDFCFALGTLITMSDGSLKSVEQIIVGDQVMGPDSRPRKVLRTKSGTDEMFRVDQTNGDSYTVNSHHLLRLKRSVDGARKERWGRRYPRYVDTIEMSAKSFSEKSQKFKEVFVGYKSGILQFPEKGVRIDPYFLGLWLGDGDSDGPRITNMDEEVLAFCDKYAKQLGMATSVQGWERTVAVRKRITNGAGQQNPLWENFSFYDLPRNKHIPADYLFNSEKVRLALLAGLLDSDGSWGGNRFRFSNLNHTLILQVKQLADQLGFRTGLQKEGYSGENWMLSIGGDTWRIPTKVFRKQSKPRDLRRSRLTSVLSVNSIGYGKYVGFEVDGDSLFVLADCTVAHNCQLPPVVTSDDRKSADYDGIPWLFRAECWERFAANTTRLTEIRRQSNPGFLQALNFLRRGEGGAAVEILKRLPGVRWANNADMNFAGTTIVGTNFEADRINNMALLGLKGRPLGARATRGGIQKSEWALVPDVLKLKIGAYVMILANDAAFASLGMMRYANGSCGRIVDVVNGNEFSVEITDFSGKGTGRIVNIGKIKREFRSKADEMFDQRTKQMCKPLYRDEKKHRNVFGTIDYFPLRLAYASTVHKSQGLTLDRIQVNARNPFLGEPAMLYVAISRCRTPEGLTIVGDPAKVAKLCNIDEEIKPWL